MLSALIAQVIPEVDLASPLSTFIDWFKAWIVFDWVQIAIGWLVGKVEFVLTWPPALAMVIILAAIAWLVRNWKFGLVALVAFGLIDSMGFFEQTMQSLALVLVATILAVAIGVPFGILAARSSKVSLLIRPVLDFMQTMPAFIYLLLAVIFFGIGLVPGVIASLIFAMPPAVRLTELGIRQVDSEVVEAAEAFGAKPSEVLRQVQLPLAMPTIMAGDQPGHHALPVDGGHRGHGRRAGARYRGRAGRHPAAGRPRPHQRPLGRDPGHLPRPHHLRRHVRIGQRGGGLTSEPTHLTRNNDHCRKDIT